MKAVASGYLTAGLAAAIVAGAAHLHVSQGTAILKDEYLAKSGAEVERGAKDIEQALQIIYHNLRTLASLPSMRSISRHGENLTPEARAAFQMIYNNLASSVSVSEVYITPADFNPDRIDPVTAQPEQPAIMFDELILNAGAALTPDQRASDPQAVAVAENQGPPEIEIHEYRLLRQQANWFSKNVPDNSAITGLKVPMIGGAEVITCDNTFFIASNDDADRRGVIFSVPFFGEDGKFRGMVSAIILSRALGELLPDKDYALINPGYGYVAAKADPPAHVQQTIPALVNNGEAGDLLFSKTVPLALMDPQSAWSVWAGYSDQAFYQSQDYVALQNLRLYGFGLALVLFLVGCLMWFMVTRDARRSQLAAVRLAEARDEARRAETEARALAEQFQGLNGDISRLNHDLNEKIRMLQDAQDEIVRKGKMAQLGQLTATIAHELRNPMSAIRNTSYLIRRRAVAQIPALAPLVARIDTGISRCDAIITQLLDFARIRKPDLSSVDLDQWLSETVGEEAASLPESVEIECNLGLGGLIVDFERDRMRRVLVNLLSNATEAMVGRPGMPVANGPSQPRVVLTTRLVSRGVEISVADNGPGMDHETLAKIREPLFTTKNFGTGLGIPAVEHILQLHGGGLDVSSEPGQGATFTAWLPCPQPSEQAA